MKTIGSLNVIPFKHPQGCCGYLIADRTSGEALAMDAHLDLVHDMSERVKTEGWKLLYVVDTHTHADHPSGARALAQALNSTRIAHEKARHAGVTVHPGDGEKINLGSTMITFRHAPGHTPDHMVLIADGALFSGDSLFIGGVARTDFLGGDAGQLFDTIRKLLADLPEDTVLFPGHDYHGKVESTLGKEKRENPWLQIGSRDEFVQKLTANPPPKPANMDDLLRLNREGVDIPPTLSADEASRFVAAGGASSVIDVRTGAEFDSEHIPGSHLIPVDQLEARADEVRAVAAPRLMLCRSGNRATIARNTLEKLHVGGMSVIEGGITAFEKAGGRTVKGHFHIPLDRQVRILIGAMILIGVLLGHFIHPGFLVLSGFLATGMVFSGITDWCGISIIVGKMPWNKSKSADTPSAGGTCAASLPPCGGCAANLPPSENKKTS